MIQNRDIVVIGIQPWDISIGSNCKNIAEEFSRHNRVLYVNPPTTRSVMMKGERTEALMKRIEVIKSGKPLLEPVNDNMWNLFPSAVIESINWIPLAAVHDVINRINAKRFAGDIIKGMKQAGFSDIILFNDSLMFMGVHMKELLNPQLYVYYMRDNLVINPFWKKHGSRLEPRLIKKADLVVNNSTMYAEYGAKYNQHSYMVGQGCDTSMYINNDSVKVPDDLLAIPGTKIGYVGFLTSRRLDVSLIMHIAQSRTDWNIVLVGPEDDVFKNSPLHQLPNVHFLGSRPPELVPNYIKGFDVTINPQVITPVTMGNYPRKVDEYLAMGKPVVCSATRAMEYFGESVYVAANAGEFVDCIAKALAEDSPEKAMFRAGIGHSHSWENSVGLIYNYIEVAEHEKSKSL